MCVRLTLLPLSPVTSCQLRPAALCLLPAMPLQRCVQVQPVRCPSCARLGSCYRRSLLLCLRTSCLQGVSTQTGQAKMSLITAHRADSTTTFTSRAVLLLRHIALQLCCRFRALAVLFGLLRLARNSNAHSS